MVQNLDSSPLYTLSGEIIHGRGIGKLVGMPTANLLISSEMKLPQSGVYISKIKYKNDIYYGITNIGTRPTVDNDCEISVETHILNFNQAIYGEHLEIQLFKMLRCIRKFEDFSALLDQIRRDCIATSEFWGIKRSYSELQMDIDKHQIIIGNHEVYLSNKEFDVLYMMYSNPDVTFTKEQIFEAVWHEPSVGCCHAVENTVFQIRKKFKAVSENIEFIKTVVGYGYKFCCNQKN